MTVRWTPQAMCGWSRSSRMACRAQGQGAIRVVDCTTPCVSVRRMAALMAWDIPKSSALTMSRRASAGYPSRSLARRFDTTSSFAGPIRWDRDLQLGVSREVLPTPDSQVLAQLHRTSFLDRHPSGEDNLQDVRGVLGGEDRGLRAFQDRDEMLRPGLDQVRYAGRVGRSDLRPALLTTRALIPLPDVDLPIRFVPLLQRQADCSHLAVDLQRGSLRTWGGEGGEDLREAVIAEVEVDEEMVWGRDVKHLTCAAGDQHITTGDGDATEGFDAPRGAEESGDGMGDVDPRIERRPDRGTIEDRRVTFVFTPGRRTHVCHLPDRQRRATEPARVELRFQPAEAVGRHHRRCAEQRQTLLACQIGRRPRIGHGAGQRLLRKNMLSGLE